MRFRALTATLGFTLTALPLFAQSTTPTAGVAGSFTGSLPTGKTFSGTGNPTAPVITGGLGGAFIGLMAQQRYSSPAVSYDGAGTWTAQAGSGVGAPPPFNTPNFSTWNFDYYIDPGTSGDIFTLFVDWTPGVGTTNGYNHWNYTRAGSEIFIDSSNLGFVDLAVPGTFDPNATGEYSFSIVQTHASGAFVDQVEMNVDVTASPEPASLVLLGTGLLGVAGIVRRRRA